MKKHEFGRQGVYQEDQDDDYDTYDYGNADYGNADYDTNMDYGAEEESEDDEE